MPADNTTLLSKLKPNQYFKFHGLIRSKRFQFLEFADGKYYYLDRNEKRATSKDQVCYIGLKEPISA